MILHMPLPFNPLNPCDDEGTGPIFGNTHIGAVPAHLPRFDYLQQYEEIRQEILTAIDRVLRSGSLISDLE